MWEGYSLLGFLVAIVLLVLDLYLLREQKIQGRTFVLWFMVSVILALFSAVHPLISIVYLFIGTQEVISAVVAVGFLFFIFVFFYLDYRMAELRRQMMKLAMEISVTKFGKRQGNPSDLKSKKRNSTSE